VLIFRVQLHKYLMHKFFKYLWTDPS